MIKILNSKIKNFDVALGKLLSKRKNKVQLNSVSVTKIIKDVNKNGDKAVLKYEKRFNKNSIIIPNPKQITKAIRSLDLKVKKAIDLAYNRIYKFHSLQKFKDISYTTNWRIDWNINMFQLNQLQFMYQVQQLHIHQVF